MHLGGSIEGIRARYKMKRANCHLPLILEETKEEKDQGVLITNDIKSSADIAAAVNEVDKILGLTRCHSRAWTYQ